MKRAAALFLAALILVSGCARIQREEQTIGVMTPEASQETAAETPQASGQTETAQTAATEAPASAEPATEAPGPSDTEEPSGTPAPSESPTEAQTEPATEPAMGSSTEPETETETPEAVTESETETETESVPAAPVDPAWLAPEGEAYGAAAYRHLRYINDTFGWRVNGLSFDPAQKNWTAQWLDYMMKKFGYTDVRVTGADHVDDHDGKTYNVTSYSYRRPGASEKRIVIGAHYDCMNSHGAEDNGTGMAMTLELAQRFANIDTPLTLEFAFWDGEEQQGSAGSYFYIHQTPDLHNVLLYINLDCLGAGDRMFVYGGCYENGVLVRDWGYNYAMKVAADFGIELNTIPALAEEQWFKAPTRTIGSDQMYFNDADIPYIYFEANAWVDAAGVEQYPNGNKAFQYNTADPRFADTQGQINHTWHDDLDHLEEMFPGRIEAHLRMFSKILTEILLHMDESTPAQYTR